MADEIEIISIKTAVRHCTRCDGDHEVEFEQFIKHPITDSDGTIYDWWGLCPVTGDPILMRKLGGDNGRSPR